MKKLLIITDYNKDFLLSINDRNVYVSMNIRKLTDEFESYGMFVEVLQFSQIDFSKNFGDYYVLYQSSEIEGQFYKNYIEDIMYFLKLKGAILLPKFEYLKAHHNKGFMELLRNGFSDIKLKSISSHYYGTSIEAESIQENFPIIIKRNSGAAGRGIYCANNMKEYNKYVRKASKTLIGDGYYTIVKKTIQNKVRNLIIENVKRYNGKVKKYISRPIITQNFIKNVSGDYKILFFGGKYYTLYRENRKNDFRASGGGKNRPVSLEIIEPLLDYAKMIVREIDFSVIGMDIGFDGKDYHLFEFQMIHLGPITLQNSEYYHIWEDNQWKCVFGKSDLEEEFSRSIYYHIKNN